MKACRGRGLSVCLGSLGGRGVQRLPHLPSLSPWAASGFRLVLVAARDAGKLSTRILTGWRWVSYWKIKPLYMVKEHMY